jgi:hypothetical protein
MKPRKISSWAVELSSGEVVRVPPPFPFGDCRGCSLINWICEWEMEYPCMGCWGSCPKRLENPDCSGCEEMDDCLAFEKPCCWECEHLLECLDYATEWGAEDFVEDVFGVSWGEFIEAVKMLIKH